MRILLFLVTTVGLLTFSGCIGGQEEPSYLVATGGNPKHGEKLIEAYGCGSCHIIPGIHAAKGLVGPPLLLMGRRTMIAGELPNTPDNLVRWIKDPPSVEAGTAMPKLGISDQEARDITAYLYSLR